MLSKSARILNFDDSLPRQLNLINKFNPKVFDFTKIGQSARLWLNSQYAEEFRKFLSSQPKNHLTFLGSGDFHHISALLIEQFSEPISVIIFDNHPDWDVLPPHLGCGSWVSYILRNSLVKEVVILGVSSSDISTFWIQTANTEALSNGRLRVYPYIHKPTRLFFKRPLKNPCLEARKRLFSEVINWYQLDGSDFRELIPSVLKDLPSNKVYVSIDKDCLKNDYALTNWEEGKTSLLELTTALSWIRNNLDVVGADIVGDYSEPKVKGIIKNICSRFDHPRDFSARDKLCQLIEETNEQTNIQLLETFLK